MPTQDYQFQKGQSGNPQGRPKGSINPATLARKVHGKALQVVAEEAEKGNLEAAIALINYNKLK